MTMGESKKRRVSEADASNVPRCNASLSFDVITAPAVVPADAPNRRSFVLWRWVLVLTVLVGSSFKHAGNSFDCQQQLWCLALSAYGKSLSAIVQEYTNSIYNIKNQSAPDAVEQHQLHGTAPVLSTVAPATPITPISNNIKKPRVDTQQLYASQEKLKDYDWEWILVKINAVSNIPLESYGTALPDPQVSLQVHADLPDDIDFAGPLTTFDWPTLWNYNEHHHDDDDNDNNSSNSDTVLLHTNHSKVASDWKGLGIAAYLAGTATSVDFTIWERNQVDQDYLLFNQTLTVFPQLDQADDDWTPALLEQHDVSTGLNITVDISWKRMTKPLYTETDHEAMGLTEHLINLENGELASIAYKVAPSPSDEVKKQHTKAVLYLAGRSDSFAHPHVLDMYYKDLGYDFYALDPRRAGRARRFMANPYLGNDVMDFGEDLYEDVDMAVQFIHEGNKYDTVVAHCHSNGALTLISYLMEKRKRVANGDQQLPPDFDGYIFNSPFLDWGNVGGSFNEFLLKNAGLWNSVVTAGHELYSHAGLSDWWTKIWLLYRWNLAWKPIFTNSLTSHYAQAASQVQWNLLQLEGHLLPHHQPVLVLSSHADDVLDHHETLRLAAEKVHPNPTLVELQWHSHDVTKSYTRTLNDEALTSIVDWLEDLETYHSVH